VRLIGVLVGIAIPSYKSRKIIKNNKGFSLIEILVTVGLIGILTGIAVPAYNNYKRNTLVMAVKADVGNGHKAYSAHDAVNGTYCATLEDVGINIIMDSQTYRKQGGYGFGAINTDCGGKPNDIDSVQKINTGYCYDGDTRQAVTGKDSMTCTGGMLSWKTDNQFGGDLTNCVIGADTFDLGAYTNTSSINTFIVVNESGKIHEEDGSSCVAVP